ncbi:MULTISPECIES: ATP-dependent DNA ligase [Streptomyces]|uniref:ATP-dependent DNA ligase n=1 Tax=Streptomyces TaxID=1883 RepID=UPI0022AF4D9F|nr:MULTISPECIES: DNA ligase [Streptomyces]MCZ4099259.1 DNA ligase [Streptomyces sp. H39-C1]
MNRPDPVVVRPQVDVMRPRTEAGIPAEDALPGGVQYSVKLDGFRTVAFALGGRTVLQTRSGRDIAAEFPGLATTLTQALPAGLVLDGEICAWADGKFAFTELLRPDAQRRAAGIVVAYVAFDCLAVPGSDIRDLPLADRWKLLRTALRDLAPQVQTVLATTDRAVALDWYETLVPHGVEGLVCKGLGSAYRPGARPGWIKVRHAETVDARLVGVIGSERRPDSVLVEFDDATRAQTSPRLDPVTAGRIAAAVAGLLGPEVRDEDGSPLRPVREGPLVEVRVRTGRQATVRFVRIRGDDAV